MASTNDDKEEPSGLLPTKRAKTAETYENKPLEESRYLDLRHQKSSGLCPSFVKNPSIKVLKPSLMCQVLMPVKP